MADCGCCLTFGSQVLVGGANIGPYTISVSVDTTRDVIWEPGSNEECEPIVDRRIYMYGPGKSTMQLTAYPFSNEEDEYTLGFTCPMEVSVQLGYKWVFDCCHSGSFIESLSKLNNSRKIITASDKCQTAWGDIDDNDFKDPPQSEKSL